MTDGAWVTMAIGTAGTFSTIITALIKWKPSKSNGNGADVPDPYRCPAHSGIVTEANYLKEGLQRLEAGQAEIWIGINEIRDDIKLLLSNGKG